MTPSIFRTPSKAAVEAAKRGAWDASGSADAAAFGLIEAYPTIVREVVEACIEVAQRVRTSEENRYLVEDRDRSRVPGLVDAAHHCGEAIEVALRAMLPDAAPQGGGDA